MRRLLYKFYKRAMVGLPKRIQACTIPAASLRDFQSFVILQLVELISLPS